MTKLLNVILVILFVLGSSLSSWAEIYIWEDENGVKHFSNDGGAKVHENVTVQDESKWSEEDEKDWERKKEEDRVKADKRRVVNRKIANDQARKKKKCSAAKEAYEKIKKKYAEFVPKPLPHYGGLPKDQIPAAIRYKRAVRRQNQDAQKQWERDKKRAYESAERDIGRYCKE